MQAFRSSSIRSYLGVVALALALPLLLLAIYNLWQDIEHAQAQTELRLRALSRTMADHTAHRIKESQALLSKLTQRPRIRALNPQNCDPLLGDLHATLRGPANLMVTNATGVVLCSAVAFPDVTLVDFRQTPWFAKLVQVNAFSIGQAYHDPISGKMVSVLSQPIQDAKGRMVGAIHLPLDLQAFDPGINAQDLSIDSRFGVYDGSGMMLWRNKDPEKVIGTQPNADIARQILALRDSAFEARSVDGEMRFFVVSPVAETDWIVFVGVPLKEVRAPAMAQGARVGALSLLALLFLAWLIYRLSKRILAPVQQLSAVVQGINRGQHSLRATPAGPAEIVEVARGFNRLMDERMATEASLHAQQCELQAAKNLRNEALRLAQLGMWRFEVATGRMHCDAQTCEMLGLEPASWQTTSLNSWLTRIHLRDKAAGRKQVLLCLAGRSERFDCIARFQNAHGSWVWCQWRGQVHERSTRGWVLTLTGTLQNISVEKERADRLHLAASVFTHAREGITITDPKGNILAVNDSFTHITGYSSQEVIGQNPRILQSGVQGAEFYRSMWTQLTLKGEWSGEIWNRRKSGERYIELLTITAVRDANGRLMHYVGMFTDITRQRESERLLAHAAHFDALTGLPNRALLTDRLIQAMHQCQRHECDLAVGYLDLDGFKTINDELGHERGDELLIEVTQNLKEVLHEGDILARLGGDEFVVVLTDLPRNGDCMAVLQRILNAAVVEVDSHAVTASMGVTFFPKDAVEAESLLRHADQAMYQAKQAGRNRMHLFDMAQDAIVRTRHQSQEDVRHALDNAELVLHYQPKVHMRSGAVIGCEALIRWQHPEQGLLFPGTFLPTTENLPLCVEIGEWVIATALSQLSQWHTQGKRMVMSVNISAYHLMQPDFELRLLGLLGAHPEISPSLLELEVLETSAMEDVEHVAHVMQRCRALGVRFALDDFGTGYSSLTYLRRLPAECIKIDQSFVRDMLHDPDDLTIVNGVIGLAKAFRREVVAEGVETPEHGEVLLALGCEYAQGWGISRAMPASQWDTWLAQWCRPVQWGAAN